MDLDNKKTRNFNKVILDNIDAWVRVVDQDYNVVFVNRAMLKELKTEVNKKCYELWGDKTPCTYCVSKSAIKKGRSQKREVQMMGRFFAIKCYPLLLDDGTCNETVEIITDVTYRKELEKQQEQYGAILEEEVEKKTAQIRKNQEIILDERKKLEEKVLELVEKVRVKDRMAMLGEISAGLAHELKNPLGSLVAGIKLMEREKRTAKEKKVIFNILKKESARLNNILSDFLDHARPRKMQPTEVDVNSILNEIIKLLQENSGSITIKEDYCLPLPLISVDNDRIKQVFWNILTNGLNSMKEKGLLNVKTAVENSWIRVDVSDSGCGISRKNFEDIFAPFFSLRKGGTGLGLAIVRRIMEEHGGTIEVESRKNKGTRFTVRFPLT